MNLAGIVSRLLLLPLEKPESPYAKSQWVWGIANRLLLLTTAILAIIVSGRTVRLLSFRLAMVVGVLGAALALPRRGIRCWKPSAHGSSRRCGGWPSLRP